MGAIAESLGRELEQLLRACLLECAPCYWNQVFLCWAPATIWLDSCYFCSKWTCGVQENVIITGLLVISTWLGSITAVARDTCGTRHDITRVIEPTMSMCIKNVNLHLDKDKCKVWGRFGLWWTVMSGMWTTDDIETILVLLKQRQHNLFSFTFGQCNNRNRVKL